MRIFTFVISIIFFSSPILYAKDVKTITPYKRHKIILLSDNDAYFDQYSDKYYSAGQRIGYTSKEFDFHSDNESKFFWLSKVSLYPKNNLTSFSINLNQEIYTPENKSYDVGYTDHPYAGGLYLSFFINQRRKYSLERIGISLGTVGEYSFAKEVQDGIHSSINKEHNKKLPWVNPVGNEFIANLYYSYTGKVPMIQSKIISMHLVPSGSLSLGNDRTYFDFNTRLLIGHNLDNTFGPLKINYGVDALGSFSDDFSIYLYGGLGYRFTARNIYIQGNTWEDPFRHELEPFVYYFEGGVTISYKHFEISYGITHKSKEYKFQPKNHTYGTILISISI